MFGGSYHLDARAIRVFNLKEIDKVVQIDRRMCSQQFPIHVAVMTFISDSFV